MSKIIDSFLEKAAKANKSIVLAEGEEPRIIKAAEILAKKKIARITLVGDEKKIKEVCPDAVLKGIQIINPAAYPDTPKFAAQLFELRKEKGMTKEQADKLVLDKLYFGVMLVHNGLCDGMVAGSICATGDVLRPALQIIKTAKGISTVSSCFVMVQENSVYGDNGVLVFGDCAVNIDPTSEQLADIAIASAHSAKVIAGMEPRVAMLSFSTKGSAKHPNVDKVTRAVEIIKEKAPELSIDGELQADAALVESVGKLKSPGSAVAGKANVLIFPDLQSGNIGYKLVQRFGNVEAIGPICQGFNKPVNDLSRGCSVDDVVNVVAITAVQAK